MNRMPRLKLQGAMVALGLLLHPGAFAQRYAAEDYEGGGILWAVFIVVAAAIWIRNRVRHWWNPEKAAAEDRSAESKRNADLKAISDAVDERLRQARSLDARRSASSRPAPPAPLNSTSSAPPEGLNCLTPFLRGSTPKREAVPATETAARGNMNTPQQ